ncbi:hypothetical protein AAD001_17030 [Colwelliaceae bacterium 6471]
MTRQEQQLNNDVIRTIKRHLTNRYRPPSYKYICSILDKYGKITARGNNWTPKRLFRMLQRQSISGLHGLHRRLHKLD